MANSRNSRNNGLQVSIYIVSFLFHFHRDLGEKGMKLENFVFSSVSFIGNFCAGMKWGICSD